MKIYCHAPRENWICDRFTHEWNSNNSEISTNDPLQADVIWLLAGWCWRQISLDILSQKKVIITIHHIVPNKFNDQKVAEFIERDKFIDAYHVPCDRTHEQISKLTSGSLSPILKRGIGLSYVDLPVDTSVNILIRNKQLKGRVIQTPFL